MAGQNPEAEFSRWQLEENAIIAGLERAREILQLPDPPDAGMMLATIVLLLDRIRTEMP